MFKIFLIVLFSAASLYSSGSGLKKLQERIKTVEEGIGKRIILLDESIQEQYKDLTKQGNQQFEALSVKIEQCREHDESFRMMYDKLDAMNNKLDFLLTQESIRANEWQRKFELSEVRVSELQKENMTINNERSVLLERSLFTERLCKDKDETIIYIKNESNKKDEIISLVKNEIKQKDQVISQKDQENQRLRQMLTDLGVDPDNV